MRPYCDPTLNSTDVVGPVCHNVAFTIEYDLLNLATGSRKLDLNDLPAHHPNTRLTPTFAPVVVKYKSPKSTILTYRNGNAVCTGTTNPEEARLVMQIHKERLLSLHGKYRIHSARMHIHNKVYSFRMGFKLDLARFADDHRTKTRYAPLVFPGLTYTAAPPPSPSITLFDTGAVNITGCTDGAKALAAFHDIRMLLLRYRDDTVAQHRSAKFLDRALRKHGDTLLARS